MAARIINASVRYAPVVAAVGVSITTLSWAERHPAIIDWQVERTLRRCEFRHTPAATFSDLTDLEDSGEIPFYRPALQKELTSLIKNCFKSKDILVVGGAGGLGKRFVAFLIHFLSSSRKYDCQHLRCLELTT